MGRRGLALTTCALLCAGHLSAPVVANQSAVDVELENVLDPAEILPGQPAVVPYVFKFSGEPAGGPWASSAVQVVPPVAGWGRIPGNDNGFAVYLRPDSSSGPYAISVFLPDGRYGETSLIPSSGTAPNEGAVDQERALEDNLPSPRREDGVCPSSSRWWTVPAEGPVFDFTPGVPEGDREAVRRGLVKATEWVRAAAGVEVKQFLVFGWSSLPEYADYFGVTLDRAASFSNAGEDCGLLQMAVQPGWSLRGSPTQQMAHNYFHMVQLGLSNRVGGSDPRDRISPIGPVWMQEGFAAYVQLKVDGGNGIGYWQDLARRACWPLHTLDTKQGMYDRDTNLTYALGFLASDYLVSRASLGNWVSFWERIGMGISWEESFRLAYGAPIESFYQDFEGHRTRLIGTSVRC